MPIPILFYETSGNVYGGGQKSILMLIETLNRNDFLPILCTSSKGSLSDYAEKCSTDVFLFQIPRIRKSFSIKSLLISKKIKYFIKDKNIKIIHCNDSQSAFYFSIFKPKNIKLIFHCRVPHSNGIFNRIIDKTIIKKCDKIIAVSKAVKDRFNYPNKINKVQIIPNGIDLQEYCPSPKKYNLHKKYNIPEDADIIVSSSRIIYGKRQHILIEAFSKIYNKTNSYLVIAGSLDEDKDYSNYLKKLVSDLNLEQYVKFTGYINDIKSILIDSDILSVATYGEAMSRTILEGMAAGKAIIASRDGGNPELIKDTENGLLVNLDDITDLSNSLLKLLNNKELAENLSKNARLSAENYSILNTTHKIENLYKELLV